ncbi:MAG: transcription elongation factor GreA [Anaerolineae bacterium]|jgi:transcription elongation factor GreA|nr:transcription elongation factor GreA [Chloroflexota bacterium]
MGTDSKQYLTPEGRARLQDELTELTSVRRKEIAEALKRAIEEGDLSENFGYSETKRQQAMLEGRIQELQTLLANAVVLEASSSSSAGLGSTVQIQEAGQPVETYQIVGPAEASPRLGRISHESPLGHSLLGHHAGDNVEIQTPGGTRRITIISIG